MKFIANYYIIKRSYLKKYLKGRTHVFLCPILPATNKIKKCNVTKKCKKTTDILKKYVFIAGN